MPIEINDFHLLRTELLLLFIPAILIFVGIRQMSKNQSSWQKIISPHLLKFLMISGEKKRPYFALWLTAIISSLIILAVSGPTFRQKSVPVFQTETARVILLDLSLSMAATDIKPSRISRAKNKTMDLLERAQEGTIGLVVYAGDAFIISPLTSDTNTIAAMIPTLSTSIMPVLGSRPDIGINKAIELLDNAKQSAGQIIWITDGLNRSYINSVTNSLASSNHILSILAVGSKQGAPIPLPDNSGFLQDSAGNIVIPKLESKNLKQIAKAVNGQYVKLTTDISDIDFIFDKFQNEENKSASESDERISRWIDDGYWISWILLLLMLIKLFGKSNRQIASVSGLSFTLMMISLLSLTNAPAANASVWDDLWQTRDQQAQQAFNDKDFKKAAELFENPAWQASTHYKKQNFTAAAQQFESAFDSSIDADTKPNLDTKSTYNYANSLAKSEQLEKALEQYDKVLNHSPEHPDALFNKKIVEDLLKQKQQKQDQQKKQDQENKEKSDSDSDSEQDAQDESKENSEDQGSEQQDSEQKNSEQQDFQEESDEQTQQQKQAELSEDQRDQEERDQALEHWLEKIPDDPGGLLRRKMYREYQRRGRQQKEKQVW